MKNRFTKGIACGLLALGFTALAARAELGAVVVVNNGVADATLTKPALKDILLGKSTFWKDGQAIVLVVANDKVDAALQEYAGMSGSQFKTHWQRLAFSGRGQQPKIVAVADAVSAVASTKGALGIVPESEKLDSVKKLDVK